MPANEVARIQCLLDLIQDFSGLVIQVKKNGKFYESIYCSKKYGSKITREIFGRSSWSRIGAFDDILPSSFVTRRTQDNLHLLKYYNLDRYEAFFADLRIEYQLAFPCEICGIQPGVCEVDGEQLSQMNFLFQGCTRIVNSCHGCLKCLKTSII